ncbi:MAG: hypothetical protein U1F06_01805 [Steroidobacteraceae bacterium]
MLLDQRDHPGELPRIHHGVQLRMNRIDIRPAERTMRRGRCHGAGLRGAASGLDAGAEDQEPGQHCDETNDPTRHAIPLSRRPGGRGAAASGGGNLAAPPRRGNGNALWPGSHPK